MGSSTQLINLNQSRTKSLRGMGLPLELWDRVVNYLQIDSEAYALLACCLTCSTFYSFASHWLEWLNEQHINVGDYTDINRLEWEMSIVAGRARVIGALVLIHRVPAGPPSLAAIGLPSRSSYPSAQLEVGQPDGLYAGIPPLIVLYRLGVVRVVNLTSLSLRIEYGRLEVHPSTWSIFGRAFRQLTRLYLTYILFPSVDFTKLLSALSNLQTLSLSSIACFRQVVPPSISRSPHRARANTLIVELNYNHFSNFRTHWFLETFVRWIVPRGGVVDSLLLDACYMQSAPSPSPLLFLQQPPILAHLSTLCLYLGNPVEEHHWRRWLG